MRRSVAWATALFLFASITVGFAYSTYSPSPAERGSVVKLLLAGGHGSGVHVGNGYIITAAHVAAHGEITVKLDDGTEMPSTTLWINEAYDIALLRVDNFAGVASSRLVCRVPEVNETVIARGNPLAMEWISTRGWIAGKTLTVRGAWQSVVPMSLPLAGGMSGGGLFDENGDLVGILVGAPLQQIGYGASMVGISYAVDGRSICNLLARP